MTEADWLAADDPSPMLEHLRGRISDRKLTLFAAACCRHLGPLLNDERCLAAVEMAERFADGRADVKELSAARTATIMAERGATGPAARAAYWTAHAQPAETVWHVHTAAAEAETRGAMLAASSIQEADWNDARDAAVHAQADLLREIVGNPFRPSHIDPAWLTWAGGTVPRIARGIFDERRFAELPVLADALEDAGCADEELLAHCRSGEDHMLGCWVVDLLLGLS